MAYSKKTPVLSLILAGALLPSVAHGTDPCEAYQTQVPIPKWYNDTCTRNGKVRSPSGGYTSIADAYQINPAQLPTHSFPYGLEWIQSFKKDQYTGQTSSQNQFALIKGFDRIGAGVASSNPESFFGNYPGIGFIGAKTQAMKYYAGIYEPASTLVSAATAFNLLPPSLSKKLNLSVGLSGKFNYESGEMSPGIGLSTGMGPLSAGVSITKLAPDDFFLNTTAISYSLRLRTQLLNIEWLHIRNESEIEEYFQHSRVTTLALSRNIFGLLVTFASRQITNFEAQRVIQTHFSLQYAVLGRFSIGYLYHYLPDAHSLGFQMLLF